jgi:hypothetical protein
MVDRATHTAQQINGQNCYHRSCRSLAVELSTRSTGRRICRAASTGSRAKLDENTKMHGPHKRAGLELSSAVLCEDSYQVQYNVRDFGELMTVAVG